MGNQTSSESTGLGGVVGDMVGGLAQQFVGKITNELSSIASKPSTSLLVGQCLEPLMKLEHFDLGIELVSRHLPTASFEEVVAYLQPFAKSNQITDYILANYQPTELERPPRTNSAVRTYFQFPQLLSKAKMNADILEEIMLVAVSDPIWLVNAVIPVDPAMLYEVESRGKVSRFDLLTKGFSGLTGSSIKFFDDYVALAPIPEIVRRKILLKDNSIFEKALSIATITPEVLKKYRDQPTRTLQLWEKFDDLSVLPEIGYTEELINRIKSMKENPQGQKSDQTSDED